MCSFHDANIRITSLISGILFKLAVQVDFSQRYGQQAFIWVEQISVRHGLNTPFDPYPGGLSRAWLQDEVMTLMTVPIEASIPRRVSFRYLKIELLGASSFDFAFDKLTFRIG